MSRLKAITQSHWLVQSPAFQSVYFTEFSGIKEKTETATVPDGMKRRTYKIRGMTSLDSMTLSTPYDPTKHDAVIATYQRLRDSDEIINVSVTPVDSNSDPKPIGKSFSLMGVQVTGIEIATVNRGSTDVAMLVLSFEADEFKQG